MTHLVVDWFGEDQNGKNREMCRDDAQVSYLSTGCGWTSSLRCGRENNLTEEIKGDRSFSFQQGVFRWLSDAQDDMPMNQMPDLWQRR